MSIFYMEEIVAPFQKNLDLLLKAKGIKKADLCRATGIATATMTRYGRGERKPTSAHLISICKFFDVTPEWLLSGEGPMRMETGEAVPGAENFVNEQGIPDYLKGEKTVIPEHQHSDNTDYLLFLKGTGMYTIGDTIRNIMERGDTSDLEELRQSKEMFMETAIRISRRVDTKVAHQKKIK